MATMMMMRIFSLLFITLNTYSLDVIQFNFEIPHQNQSFKFIDLRAQAEANKIIRNNAYLSLRIEGFDASSCWLDYINNRKIKIQTSESYYRLVGVTKKSYKYVAFLNLDKTYIKDLDKNDLNFFCNS